MSPNRKGTGGNKTTVMHTIPKATKEKANVQGRRDMRNSQSDITWALRGQELVQVRMEEQGRARREECVGRGRLWSPFSRKEL